MAKTTGEREREREREREHQIFVRIRVTPKSLLFRALYFLSNIDFENFAVLDFLNKM